MQVSADDIWQATLRLPIVVKGNYSAVALEGESDESAVRYPNTVPT